VVVEIVAEQLDLRDGALGDSGGLKVSREEDCQRETHKREKLFISYSVEATSPSDDITHRK
jgi:hypothetical protein